MDEKASGEQPAKSWASAFPMPEGPKPDFPGKVEKAGDMIKIVAYKKWMTAARKNLVAQQLDRMGPHIDNDPSKIILRVLAQEYLEGNLDNGNFRSIFGDFFGL